MYGNVSLRKWESHDWIHEKGIEASELGDINTDNKDKR